jgi:2-keto-4-pentenoate hydratase
MTIDIADAARRLATARLAQQPILLPPALRPANAQDAYAIQDEIGRLLGGPVRAWKVGAPDSRTEPNAAPIYALLASPARIAAAPTHLIGVEAELAAVFAQALPARDQAYSEAEVMAAVQEVKVTIEVCESRLADWQAADDLTKLADHQLNFALVTGEGTRDFSKLDFAALTVCTRINGKAAKTGTGTHAVGNPMRLLTWLANHVRRRGGMAAGTVVTTGAWLGLHPIAPGDEVMVEFPAIGSARVTLGADAG